MPKLKTHRGAAKRFKITKGGKIKRNRAFGRHLLSSKSPKRRRKFRRGSLVNSRDAANVKQMLPYG